MKPSGRVFAVGETVLDIILSPDGTAVFRPGGSVLNSAVSLARCGIGVEFISVIGDDPAGDLVLGFLAKNQVSTRYCRRNGHEKTTLALATLNEDGEASYSFYRSADTGSCSAVETDLGKDDLLLFGSFFALHDDSRPLVEALIAEARQRGATVLYDPNFRKPHLHERDRLMPRIRENMAAADIVRASDEDCRLIFGCSGPDEAFEAIRQTGCRRLVYTMNRHGARFMTPGITLTVPAIALEPVSTVGAGDAFNAGLIYSLILAGRTRNVLPLPEAAFWTEAVSTGIRFASEVCRSFDNYVPVSFAQQLKKA